MSETQPRVSVVVPIFNEEASIEELYSRIVRTLEERGDSFELITVDDGSTDRSLAILRGLRAKDARVRVIRLTRNFGQSPALYAGFSRSRGEFVVMLDADLQNFPEDIPKLLERLEEGYDVVSGWRAERHDGLFRRMTSRMLNAWVGRITKLRLHDYGCALKGFRRDVVDRMNTLSHRCRYLPADMAMLGGAVSEVQVRHAGRDHGKSKYGVMKLFRTAFDLLTGVTSAPLQFIGMLGWLFAAGGFAMSLRVALVRLIRGDLLQLETVVAVFFLLAGVQLIATGLMCEYIGRIYIEVQRKPYFVVHEEVD
jgi:undecaprenyl-phosphate 4-deoxy-4-formamido-L-arabinose transferase